MVGVSNLCIAWGMNVWQRGATHLLGVWHAACSKVEGCDLMGGKRSIKDRCTTTQLVDIFYSLVRRDWRAGDNMCIVSEFGDGFHLWFLKCAAACVCDTMTSLGCVWRV
jgi:hypothetical protein